MKIKDIVNSIDDEKIISFMNDKYSADCIITPGKNEIVMRTVCHNGAGEGKKKLYYYTESKSFHCYSSCGHIGNIYNLVMHIEGVEFKEAFKIVNEALHIQINTKEMALGFIQEPSFSLDFLKKDIRFKEKRKSKTIDLNIKSDNVLREFWDIFHQSWIDDFISIETMKVFNIKYDISNNAIIIPHYNIDNQLLGIRVRNLNQALVDTGMKYIPLWYDGVMYNYPTGTNLYGLNINKHNISESKVAIIGEAEKFVLQSNSYYKKSIALALSGSSIQPYQIKLLKNLGVEEIIIALDKEYKNIYSFMEYFEIVDKKIITPLLEAGFKVQMIVDQWNKLEYKAAPTDYGKETFEFLLRNRFNVNTIRNEIESFKKRITEEVVSLGDD